MIQCLIREQPVGAYFYNRYEIDSSILGRKNTFGILTFSKPGDEPPQETIYFFHGGDGDDQQFVLGNFLNLLSEETLRKLLQKKIQIVLPFIGLSYLKAPMDQHILQEVMPWVEKGMVSPRRSLWGVSMGGTGALNLFLKNLNLFQKIAVHFAGLIQFNPFDELESREFQKKTGITSEKLGVLRYCYQTPFQDFNDFKNNDPFFLFSKCDLEALKKKSFYWDCGEQDDFGLNWGARAFEALFRNAKIQCNVFIREGAHDFAYLQKHLNESAEFLLK